MVLALFVQPRSSKNRFAGLHGEALKLCITAPPVDGKANEAVKGFLAGFFRIPKSTIRILSGETSRSKRLLLPGLSIATAQELLQIAPDRQPPS